MFEKAVREKLRFNFKGWLSVEDLWDLSLEDLDEIYKKLSVEMRNTSQDSLLQIDTTNDTLQLKIDVVKRIVEVKLIEREERKEAAQRLLQKRRIKEIIAEKQLGELKDKSLEELNGLLEQLG